MRIDYIYYTNGRRIVIGSEERNVTRSFGEIVLLNGKKWEVVKSIDDYEVAQSLDFEYATTKVVPAD